MLERLTKWEFWDRALARALRTALQGLVATTATCATFFEIDWVAIASGTALLTLTSIANSIIAGLPELDEDR